MGTYKKAAFKNESSFFVFPGIIPGSVFSTYFVFIQKIQI